MVACVMINLKELPNDVGELKKIILDLSDKKQFLQNRVDFLLEEIELWKKRMFLLLFCYPK